MSSFREGVLGLATANVVTSWQDDFWDKGSGQNSGLVGIFKLINLRGDSLGLLVLVSSIIIINDWWTLYLRRTPNHPQAFACKDAMCRRIYLQIASLWYSLLYHLIHFNIICELLSFIWNGRICDYFHCVTWSTIKRLVQLRCPWITMKPNSLCWTVFWAPRDQRNWFSSKHSPKTQVFKMKPFDSNMEKAFIH